MDRCSVRIQSLCATGSASASFHDQKTVITIFHWMALAEPVAHEILARYLGQSHVECNGGDPVAHSLRAGQDDRDLASSRFAIRWVGVLNADRPVADCCQSDCRTTTRGIVRQAPRALSCR